MLHHAATGLVLVVPLALGAGLLAQDAWVATDSREAKDALLPTIDLTTATGFEVSLEPASDGGRNR